MHKNYIDGRWTVAVSEETFESRNPSNVEEVIGLFPRSRDEDVAQAVAAAKSAFPTSSRGSTWPSTSSDRPGCLPET